ncbi:hypothetical protein ACU8V1_14390 [Rhizobium leguminosarum]
MHSDTSNEEKEINNSGDAVSITTEGVRPIFSSGMNSLGDLGVSSDGIFRYRLIHLGSSGITKECLCEDNRSPDQIRAEVISRYPSLVRHQDYEPGTVLGRTVKYLNVCLLTGQVPRKPKGPALISRVRVAHGVGVHPATISKCLPGTDIFEDYEAVLERVVRALPILNGGGPRSLESLSGAAHTVAKDYPALLKHQFYDPKSTYRAIVDMLNDQIVSGNLQKIRGGKLSRRFIAERLGVTKTAMTHYLEIFHDYETTLGNLESEAEAKIPAFRAWLLDRMHRGVLELWDGKINRRVEGELFGIEQLSSDASRYPRVGKLLDEIDKKIAASGYKGPGVDAKLATLRALLANNPALNNDKLTINRQALSAASGITNSVLRRPPYLPEIHAAEAAIRQVYEKDPLVILVDGRVLEFHTLLNAGWQKTYVVALAKRFSQVFGKKGKDTASHHLSAMIELLTYLSSSNSPYCLSLFRGISAGASVKSLESDFDRAGIEYSSEMSLRYNDPAYRRKRISLANIVVRHMSAEGLLPRLSIRLKCADGPRSSHIPTLAEAVEKGAAVLGKPLVDDYLAFATMMLKQASELRQIQLDRGDQSAFSSLLRAEIDNEPYTAADNPATLILRVLNRRFELIKTAAVRV